MADQNSFRIIPPVVEPIPFILSIPHCGTSFPDELKSSYKKEIIENPDDTDWDLDLLYDLHQNLALQQ